MTLRKGMGWSSWWIMEIPPSRACLVPAKETLLAVQDHLALVLFVNSEETLHQRGLAGAVLAHEGVHASRAHVDADVVQGLDARKAFGDVAHLHYVDGIGHECVPPVRGRESA